MTAIEFHGCLSNLDAIMKVEATDDEAVGAFGPKEWGGIVTRLSA